MVFWLMVVRKVLKFWLVFWFWLICGMEYCILCVLFVMIMEWRLRWLIWWVFYMWWFVIRLVFFFIVMVWMRVLVLVWLFVWFDMIVFCFFCKFFWMICWYEFNDNIMLRLFCVWVNMDLFGDWIKLKVDVFFVF